MSAEEIVRYHLAQMHDWLDGRKSWTNLGPNAPYTPDVVAAMDAQEVVKHAAAVKAYGDLIGLGLDFPARGVTEVHDG